MEQLQILPYDNITVKQKMCNKCLCEKNLENFPIQEHFKKKYYSSWCKCCHCEYSKMRNKYDSEKQKEYYKKNKDKMKILCECGKYIFEKGIKKHVETKIHFTRLSNQVTEDFIFNNLKKF